MDFRYEYTYQIAAGNAGERLEFRWAAHVEPEGLGRSMFAALSNPKVLRRIGFALFALSFLTPNWRFEGMGGGAFIVVPQLVWSMFSEGDVSVLIDWHMVALIGSLSLGWLSNFTVFFSLPYPAAVTAIAAPWILFLAMILLWSSGPDVGIAGFIPFYPWAFGIGMIHCSRLIDRRHIAADAPALAQSRETI